MIHISENPTLPVKPNKKIFILIFFILAVGIVIGFYFLPDIPSNNDEEDPENYSWDDDPNRLDLLENVFNLTLIIDYGNGTINITENIDLAEHYTSAFDIINLNHDVEYKIYDVGEKYAFYITAIDGLKENLKDAVYWQYFINGIYSQVGANQYQLHDNDIVNWKYTNSQFS